MNFDLYCIVFDYLDDDDKIKYINHEYAKYILSIKINRAIDLSKMINLKKISLQWVDNFDSSIFLNLKELKFHNCYGINLEGLKIDKLTILYCTDVSHLETLVEIKKLKLHSCNNFDIYILDKFKKLKELSLKWCKIDEPYLHSLKLDKLEIEYCNPPYV